MKISYNTSQDKNIQIEFNQIQRTLCPDENVDIGDKENIDFIQISTSKTAQPNILDIIMLFLRKMLLSIFNVCIMNFPKKWFDELDPFIVSATYKVKQQVIKLHYIPTKMSQYPICIDTPQLKVNDLSINTQVKVDMNAIRISFIKYCFELLSLWIYCSLLIALIFIFSGKFLETIVWFGCILACITFPLILKLVKTYKEKQKMVLFLTTYEK